MPNNLATNFACAAASPFGARLALPFLIVSVDSVPRECPPSGRRRPVTLGQAVMRTVSRGAATDAARMSPRAFNTASASPVATGSLCGGADNAARSAGLVALRRTAFSRPAPMRGGALRQSRLAGRAGGCPLGQPRAG